MANSTFVPISGVIQSITPQSDDCCTQQVSIRNAEGITNFVISPATYVIQEVRLRPGLSVSAFYDSNLPIPLIYPPQYQAVIIGRRTPNETIYAGYFDENLTAEDDSLRLNVSRSTEILTSNGQRYNCSLAGQFLIVYYTTSTRSIPALATPHKVIVMC